jgi:hypothetical protein
MKVRFLRFLLALRKGRIISIAAPVVPIQEARAVPMASMMTLITGVPVREPRSRIPPEMVYSDHRRMMKGT